MQAAVGRSRGGYGSKLHLVTKRVTKRGGKPILVALRAGKRHESPRAIPLLEQSLNRIRPEAIAGDKGYSASALRTWPGAREIAAVIPYREDEPDEHAYDHDASRERSMIERAINRLTRYRRIATRFDKLASSYLAMVTIACMLAWL